MSQEVLSELQLLTSMYDSSQIHFDDLEVALKVENGISISGSVSLTLKLDEFLQLSLRIPEGYPSIERLSASCQIMKGTLKCGTIEQSDKYNSQLNTDLSVWLKSGDTEDRNVLGVVNWINERREEMCTKGIQEDMQPNPKCSEEDDTKLCRIWIHSHHIYNEKKRKFILDTARNLALRGFSLPGKPGFICVEGYAESCDDFWTQIRQLSWQKISLIERQILDESQETFARAFSDFEEIRLDMSGFMKYLEEKQVSSVIKGYLGFG